MSSAAILIDVKQDRARREAEEAARLDATLEALADGVVVFDRDERVQRANAALRALLALDARPDAAEGFARAPGSLLAPRDLEGRPLPPEAGPIRRVLRGETLTGPAAVDLRVRARDGQEREVSVSGAPIRAPDGAIIGGVLDVRDVTERRRLERAVAARAGELEATVEAMADGLGVFDRDGGIVRTNAALRALLAVDGDPDVLGRPPHARAALALSDAAGQPLPPEDWPAARVLRGEVLTGDRALDVRLRTRDGRAVAVSVSGAPVYDGARTPIGAVLVFRDVTERRRLEREVTERVGELEATIDSIADAVYVYDTAGRLLRANGAGRALLPRDRPPDYATRPVEGRVTPFAARDGHGQPLPPEDWPLRRILRGETLAGAPADDVLIRDPDGQDRHVTMSGAPVRDRDGRGLGAVVIVHDVTARRRAEQRTREALEALLAMAEALVLVPLGGAGAAVTEDGVDDAVAQRLAELARHVLDCRHVSLVAVDLDRETLRPLASAGLPPAQERRWRDRLRAEPARTYDVDPALGALLAADEAAVVDMRRPPYRDLPNPSGAGVVLIAPLRTGEGFVGILAADRGDDARPFTDDEVALARATARLAALVIERAHLQGARAEAARLAALNHARAAFVATVSHELRTPLTSIRAGLGFLERAVGDQLGPDERDLLDAIRRNTERLRVQIADLLAANRLDADALHPARAPLDLAAVARTALAEVRPLLDEKGQAVTLDLPTPLPIAGDARLLGQVVTNLLANVYRHTPDGTRVTLAGWVAGDDGDGGEVRLCVGDDGPGLPPDELEAIFGRFHRADAAAGGSGLGLSIAREIAALHDGRLWAENAAGGGAVFHLALPRRAASVGDAGTGEATGGQDERAGS